MFDRFVAQSNRLSLASFAAFFAVLALMGGRAEAGVFGVPTNLTAAGAVTGASVDPPGWLVLSGTNFGGLGSASGDVVHQMRFYIEVTGPTLAIRVFDPGTGTGAGVNGARDNNTTNITTQYRFLDPAGNPYNVGGGAAEGGPLAIVNDTGATENALNMFSCNNAAAPTFVVSNSANFFGTGSGGGVACATALSPGLYIFEVSISVDGNAANAFGAQFTDAAGVHYNAYTVGASDDINAVAPAAQDNSLIFGRVNEGAGIRANITEPVTFFPLVDRTCSFQTSNFDGGLNIANEGGGSTATTTSPGGAVNTLTVSSDNDHAENSIVAVSPNGPNYASTNYGMFPISHTLGGSTLNNWVDWRANDSVAWGTATLGNLPIHGLFPIKTYLSNGYAGCVAGVPGTCVHTAPAEPIFTISAVHFSGPNPPVVGSATVYTVTATVTNPTTTALANVRITAPLTSATTFVAASQLSFIDGAASACVDTSTATARICTFAALASGSTASLQYQATVTPAAAGKFQITGIPPAQIFGVTGIVTAGALRRATTAGNHGYVVGDRVIVSGANEAGFNGVVNITAVAATTFDYEVPTGTAAAATVPAGRLIYAEAVCTGALNAPACATYQPAWATAAPGISPGLGSAGAACDLRANALGGPVDVSLTKTAPAGPVNLGTNIAYTIGVTTAGAVAPNVQWSDTLPAGTSFVSLTVPVTVPPWACTTPQVGAGGNVICIRSSMPVSGPDNFTLTVRADSATGAVSNTAAVTSSGQDTNNANNSATAVTTLNPGADLRIVKVGSPNAQPVGSNITFVLQVTNLGPSAVTPTVTDNFTLANTWTFQSIAAGPNYNCLPLPAVNAAGTVTCVRLSALAAGATDNITLTLRIAALAPIGPLNNTATVTPTVGDPNVLNNTSTDPTQVVSAATCNAIVNGVLTTGVINDYWPGTASTVAGATSITLGLQIAGGAGSTIAIGDYLMVMQMQDGTFNSTDTDAYGNGIPGDMPATAAPGLRSPTLAASGSLLLGNVGRYEYVVAQTAVGAGGGPLTLTTPLQNAYTTSAPAFNAAGSNGQRSFQVIRVPVYNGLTLTGTMLAAPWLGTSNTTSGGGVLALEDKGTLNLNGFGFNATARGFRGGRGLGASNNNNFNANHVFRTDTGLGPGADNFGFKGEGINGSTSDLWIATPALVTSSGYPGGGAADGDRGMGAPGNAGGGGSWDAAGGGGANGGSGGGGGDEYCTAPGCQPGDLSSAAHAVGWTGGRGGLLSFTPSFSQVVMGGGGGGGADHNSADPNRGNGGLGGGLIMVRANAFNLVSAGTVSANGGNAPTPSSTGNAGGGGAGGSVILSSFSSAIPATVTITANGGDGGPSTDHAPGAGGGGGAIFVSPGSLAVTSAAGGNNGFRTGTFPGNTNAEPGADGIVGVLTSPPPPAASSACGAVVDLGVTINAPDTAVAGNNISYPIAVVNNGPVAAPNTSLVIPVPPDSTFVSFSAPAGWTCTTPLVGGTGIISCNRTAAAMPAFTTENFTLVTRVDPGTPAGTVINAIATVSTTANESTTANNVYQDNTVIQQATTPALTRVTIRGFSADPLTGTIEFATGMQRGTSSFNLYAIPDPNDLERRELLNQAPIVAPFPNSVAPIVYKIETRPFGSAYVVIEETEIGGKIRAMGPFGVGDPKMLASLERIRTRLSRSGALPTQISGADVQFLPSRNNGRLARYVQKGQVVLRAQKAARRGRAGARDGLKLLVDGPGLVSVKRSDLEAEGLPQGARTRSIRLFTSGQPVSYSVVGAGASEAIVFDAVATDVTYTQETVYLLTWSGVRPVAQSVPLSKETDPSRPGFTRVERNVVYVASLAQGTDPWVWDLIVGDNNPWPYSYDPAAGDFDLPLLRSQNTASPVRVKVNAYSPLRHQVRAFINDFEIGSVEFEGAEGAFIDGLVPPGTLHQTGNRVSLRYSAVNATFDDPGYLYLDYVEVAADSASPAPRMLAPENIQRYSTTIALSALSADYLIVTHPDFLDQAEALAEFKRAQGRRAAVVDVNRAYDRYAAGFVEAAAVKALIAEAVSRRRLRDVVLFGDDTLDYRNFYGLTEFPVIPSLMGWDGEFGRVPSENRFADVDGDGAPDVAIGRLPAQTDADADAVIAKIQRQQAVLGAQHGRHLMVVDNQGLGDPSFRTSADQVVSAHLRGASSLAWSDLTFGIAAARQDVLTGLATAPAVTHYFGHGGPEIWADEQVLTVDDVPSLSALPESVFFQWACETQFFPYFLGRSLGEALLLQPTGGALASFGPSGVSESSTQSLLYNMLYTELSDPNITLGEAIRRAKSKALTVSPEAHKVVEGFNLLGDPSLKLGGLKP